MKKTGEDEMMLSRAETEAVMSAAEQAMVAAFGHTKRATENAEDWQQLAGHALVLALALISRAGGAEIAGVVKAFEHKYSLIPRDAAIDMARQCVASARLLSDVTNELEKFAMGTPKGKA